MRLFLALVLALATLPVAAQQRIEQRMTAGQFKAAGLDKLSAAELAALNAFLDAAPPRATAPAVIDDTRFAGQQEGAFKARLHGTLNGWVPGDVVTLDNGQRWQVLKGEQKLRKPVVDAEVELVPGIAGRWFLRVDEDLPMARVQRIE